MQFQPNEAQAQLYRDMHFLNVILKARQLGFTTFIDIFILDAVLFNSHQQAGIIAHTLDDAKKIFKNKIKFPYDNLPDWLKQQRTLETVNTSELGFNNGSSVYVGTSMRSGTLQYLHVSEMGKIAKKFPDKANEIKTGAFNTVHPGQFIAVESTAEGRSGLFFDIVQEAKARAEEGRKPGKTEFKFLFYPWWKDRRYRSNELVQQTTEEKDYFRKLREQHGIHLEPDQEAWYVLKWRMNRLGDSDDMKQEYPSTPEEAFEVQLAGAYYGEQISVARQRGRITVVPYEPSLPVNTFWDLGRNDTNAIWFHQRVGLENRFIDYYENSGEGLGHYARVLKNKDYVYGRHYLPHDVEVTELTRDDNKTRKEVLEDLGVKPIEVVPRISDVLDGIELVRNFIPSCWFDKEKCDKGIKALEAYRKEWDEKRGTYKDRPYHDWSSNAADAFRQAPQGFKDGGGFKYQRRPVMRRR